MGDPGISWRGNEGGEEGAMPTSEPTRDFPERDSHISLQSTESDFHIPDDAESLTLPKRRRTTKKVERLEMEIDRLTLYRKIDQIARKINTNQETTQYLLITNLSDNLRDYLLEKNIGGVRLTLDDQNILLRIMPSVQHGCIIGRCTIFLSQAMDIAGLSFESDRWEMTGAATKQGGFCAKEPDVSMVPKPHPLSTIVGAWPSLVVEIGLSESQSHFYKDVKWWLHNSNHNTRLVLLLKIHRQPFWVDVELWSEGLEIDPQPESPVLKQSIRVKEDVITSLEGSSLDIHLDYEMIMREARPSGQEDIIITQQMLRRICKEMV